MADLYASRAPVRLNDGTADANNVAVLAAAPSAGDYGLTTRQVGIAAAAALADATANPTTVATAVFNEVFGGTTWDRARSITAGADTTGTGIAAAGLMAQLDDTATTAVTENQFAPIRLSTRRALLVEGVASGTAITVDTELPAAAALSDTTVNPTTSLVGSMPHAFNGTTWDRFRNHGATDGNAASTALSAIVPMGIGPGFARRFNPSNLATAANSTSAVDVNGAGTAAVQVNTSTTGTYIIEVTVDGTTWKSAQAENYATGANVTGVSLTPTAGDIFIAQINGMRQWRLRTVTTLGATMAHVVTLSMGDALISSLELPALAALADATANPSLSAISGYLMGYNGTTWDRVRTANTGRLQVDVVTGGGGSQTDASAWTVAVTGFAPGGGVFNDSATVLSTGTQGTFRVTTNRALHVNLRDNTGTQITTAAAALADAVSNPTIGGIETFLMGYNGSTWDRVRTANTGRLQVDVITGGSSPPASEVPTLYNALLVYGTTSATGAGSTASVTTNTPANTKTFYVRHILVAASGQTKWQVKFGATVLATGFIPQTVLSQTVRFDPPIAGTGDGSTALTIDVTNREASAMDLYARMGAIVLA